MELIVEGSFYRDLKNYTNHNLLNAVYDTIYQVQNAKNISQIQNLIKLEKYNVHYRIKVSDDYRIGIIIRGNKVWFARFGHRNIFYKKLFP